MLKITINTFIAPSKEEIIQINDPYSYFKINPYFIIGTLLSIRTYPRIFRGKIKPLGSTFKPVHVRIDYVFTSSLKLRTRCLHSSLVQQTIMMINNTNQG